MVFATLKKHPIIRMPIINFYYEVSIAQNVVIFKLFYGWT